jgi:hypothetical protein
MLCSRGGHEDTKRAHCEGDGGAVGAQEHLAAVVAVGAVAPQNLQPHNMLMQNPLVMQMSSL